MNGMTRSLSRSSRCSASLTASPPLVVASGGEAYDALAAITIDAADCIPTSYTGPGAALGGAVLGCAHYRSGCKFRAECCGSWHVCRFCHDEQEDHAIDRHAIKYMACLACKHVQRAAQACAACTTTLARYYCNECKLWDDSADKHIFHCAKCTICRIGKVEDYVHCDRCSGCIHRDHAPTHKCLDGCLQSDCPICGENLFTTTLPIMFMPCGHSIHYLCHQDHIKNSYQCPICLKSLTNMEHLFARIDELMSTQTMPDEYASVRAQILCNDCEKKSIAKFHFVYHACALCSSYNTKVLRTFNEKDDPSALLTAGSQTDTSTDTSIVEQGADGHP